VFAKDIFKLANEFCQLFGTEGGRGIVKNNETYNRFLKTVGYNPLALKGQYHEIFDPWFFSPIISLQRCYS
jgi:hypothetical protein